MWHEPSAYSWKHDRRLSVETYRQWAEAAWLEAARECPETFGDGDYAMGFRDGFVDYVYAGGNGEPPPVPPRHYWNVMLRSPEGKQQADRWFAGYRHGAQSARNGGYRDLGTIRSSLAAAAEPYEQSMFASELADSLDPNVNGSSPHVELIPEPRATPNFPAMPAPDKPVGNTPAADGVGESDALPPAQDSTAPSTETPSGGGNSSEQPDDLPLPSEEPLGDPFQSDGANRKTPRRTPRVELAAGTVGEIQPIHRLPATAEKTSTGQEPEGSTIRMLAAPINAAQGNEPMVVVHLVPTQASRDALQVQEPQPDVTGNVQLTSALGEVKPSIEASASTIRIRTTPEHERSAHLPLVPKRKPKFLR